MKFGVIVGEKHNGAVSFIEGGRDIGSLKTIFKKMKIEKSSEYAEVMFFISGGETYKVRFPRKAATFKKPVFVVKEK